MTLPWKSLLLMSLVMGMLRSGRAIKCYKCSEYSGTDALKVTRLDVLPAPCLNKASEECPSQVKNCQRITRIHKAPSSYEENVQGCGDPRVENLTCGRSQSWTDDGRVSSKSSECYCIGDNCNGAKILRGESVLFLASLAFYGAVRLSKWRM